LAMRTVAIPRQSGAYCATGMLNSDIRKEFLRSVVIRLNDQAPGALVGIYADLASKAQAFLAMEGFEGEAASLVHQADMRFAGQQSDIPITLEGPAQSAASMRERFEEEYQRLFGHVPRQGTIEIRGARVIGCGQLQRIRPLETRPDPYQPEPSSHRRVYANEALGFVRMPVYDGCALRAGARIVGPAIVEEATTTIALTGHDVATLNRFGEYIIDLPETP
jgi:N-methylhydantoinase A